MAMVRSLSRACVRLLAVLAFVVSLSAAVYPGVDGPVRQPDGSVIATKLYGDEFIAWLEHDGFTIVKDPANGFWCYARREGDDLVPTTAIAGKADPRALGLDKRLRQAPAVIAKQVTARRKAFGVRTDEPGWGHWAPDPVAMNAKGGGITPAPPPQPTVGTITGLVVLVDFSDEVGNIGMLGEIESFCNGDNYTGSGNSGSIKKYYFDASNGKLTFTNSVNSLKYVRAPHPKSYYNQDNGVWRNAGEASVMLLTDVMTILNGLTDSQRLLQYGIDYSALTTNASNVVNAMSLFYAGDRPPNDYWGKGLWPHASKGGVAIPLTGNGAGKTLTIRQITDMRSELSVGTFLHECGHMVCYFPDFYNYADQDQGVGRFCLMDAGSYNNNAKTPARVNGYMRYKAGWIDPADFVDLGTLGVAGWGMKTATETNVFAYGKSAGSSSPAAMGPGVTEYFLIETRVKTGWDAYLPDEGLAIWHVDETSTNSTDRPEYKGHFECGLVQADGFDHLTLGLNSGDDQDLYPATSPSNFELTSGSTPSSRWWDGSDSGLAISQIAPVAGVTQMFRFGSALPVFQVQPATTVGRPGETVTFSVTVLSQPDATLSWERSPNGIAWTTIPGATGSTYSFLMTEADSGAWFHCIATNTAGSTTSTAAQLKLSPPPAVNNSVIQPAGGAVGRAVPASIGSLESGGKSCGVGSGLGLVCLGLLLALAASMRRQRRKAGR